MGQGFSVGLRYLHTPDCSSLNINHAYSEHLKSFRGTACRGLPAYHRVPVGRALLCAPPRAPGAFINDACIIEPFMVREQVQRNRELPQA